MTCFKLIRNIAKILNVKYGEKHFSLPFFEIFIEEKRNSRFVEAFVTKVFYDISETFWV